MATKREKCRSMWRKAAELIPLGVNSNYRYWGDDETIIVERADLFLLANEQGLDKGGAIRKEICM